MGEIPHRRTHENEVRKIVTQRDVQYARYAIEQSGLRIVWERAVSIASRGSALDMQAAEEPDHQKDEQCQAQSPSEPGPPIPAVPVVATATAQQQDDHDDDQNQAHFAPCLPTPALTKQS